MSREAALRSGRRRLGESLTDTAVVRRQTGRTVQSEVTGREEQVLTVVFTTPCKVTVGGLATLVPVAKERTVGGGELTTLREIMVFPVTAPAVKPNDEVEITAIGPYSDPQLLGRKLRVVSPIVSSHTTARKFSVEEVTG